MTEIIYIYTLSDDSGVRYVGQTNKPKTRLSYHKYNGSSGRDNTEKGQWIKRLMDNGKVPTMTIVEECDFDDSYKREAYWKTYHQKQGCNLLNEKGGPKRKSPLLKSIN